MTTLHKLTSALFALAILWMGPLNTAQAQVQVTAASPASAPQGSVSLDVEISGSGFDATAAVQFLVTGTTNPGGITVRKVAVRGSKKIIATIDIADTAVIDKFDVQVALSDGRKGKGTTLFAVVAKVTGDACATPGLDFPAFIYWTDGGNQTTDYFVADSTGACSRRVLSGIRGQLARFSYPVAGTSNVGRIVYLDRDLANNYSIQGVDFDAAGTNISVGPRYTISTAVPAWLDLSPSGQDVYYSFNTSVNGLFTGHIFRINITDQLGTAGTEVYAQTPWATYDISVSADETAIYATQDYLDVSSPPPYPGPVGRRLVRIVLANPNSPEIVTQGLSDYFSAANDSTSVQRFAFAEPMTASGLNCPQLSTGQWTGAGFTVTPLQAFGWSRLTWHNGGLLVNGYTPPNRRGQCAATGMITRVSPTGAITPLVRGLDPDGR